MKKNLVPLLGIAFVVAIVSTGIIYGLFAGRLKDVTSRPASAPIAVAARRLERGTVLQASDVRLSPVENASQQAGAFLSAEQVTGLAVAETTAEGTPLTQKLLSPVKAGAAGTIPAGQRAVSVRVMDSPGITDLLRVGHRVDVQMVSQRTSNNGADTEVRTVLQGVKVLGTQPPPEGVPQRHNQVAIVTLLAEPAEAELLSFADASARVRLTLRNPEDDSRVALNGLSTGGRLKLGHSPAAAPPPRTIPPSLVSQENSPAGRQVALTVQFASASPAAVSRLAAYLTLPRQEAQLQVSALRQECDLDRLVKGLEAKRDWEVLSATRLIAGNHREVSVLAGTQSTPAQTAADGGEADRDTIYRLSLQFQPTLENNGRLRVRVQPELAAPQRGGWATRRIATDVEVADGQSFVVGGFVQTPDASRLIETLFPRAIVDSQVRELMVVVTPRLVKR